MQAIRSGQAAFAEQAPIDDLGIRWVIGPEHLSMLPPKPLPAPLTKRQEEIRSQTISGLNFQPPGNGPARKLSEEEAKQRDGQIGALLANLSSGKYWKGKGTPEEQAAVLVVGSLKPREWAEQILESILKAPDSIAKDPRVISKKASWIDSALNLANYQNKEIFFEKLCELASNSKDWQAIAVAQQGLASLPNLTNEEKERILKLAEANKAKGIKQLEWSQQYVVERLQPSNIKP